MKKKDRPIAFPLQVKVGFVLIVSLAVLLSGCTANSPSPVITFQPNPDDVDLAGWEEAYPEQYAEWAESVHGETYLAGDTNAPTCNDCHDAPVEGEVVNTPAFHLETPARCARCHDDEGLMAEYEIATDVYETYIADFHGVTINYYAQTDPNTIRDEAVCSDCHGSHAIYPQDDARSSISEANLKSTCAKCHSGATEAFTSAYGHYRPIQSPASTNSDSTIVYIVKLLYQILIPITLGSMFAYIVLDIYFRIKGRAADKPVVAEQVQTESVADPENEAKS